MLCAGFVLYSHVVPWQWHKNVIKLGDMTTQPIQRSLLTCETLDVFFVSHCLF